MSWIIATVIEKISTYSRLQELKLAEAVAINDVLQLRKLLKQGIDPNIKIIGSQSLPLIFLAFEKHQFTIPKEFIGDLGEAKTLRDRHKHLYHLTVKSKCLDLLLEHGANPNVRDSFGRTPLSIAITWCLSDTIKLLLKYGADPNLKDGNEISPLMKTVMLGIQDARPMADKLSIAEDLIEFGADINAQQEDGTTALMYAAGRARMEMAELLVRKGASLSIQDRQGNQAVDLVKKTLNRDRRNYLIKLLQQPKLNFSQENKSFEPEGDRLLQNLLSNIQTTNNETSD